MRARLLWGAVILGIAGVSHLEAQVGWDSPMLVAPGSPGGLQVLLIDPHASDGVGVLGIWRQRSAPGGLGFRVGVTEDHRDDAVVFGGVDFSGTLTSASSEFPLDVIWVSGIGASLPDDLLVSVPVGLSMGKAIQSPDVTLLPYGGPRVVIDAFLGDDERRDDIGIDVVVDLGLDLAFDAGWAIRFGATVGDRQAVAIGASFGSGIG